MMTNVIDTNATIISKGAAGLRKAGRLAYENEGIRVQIQILASAYAAADNAETNLYRYNNGMAAMWMAEIGEDVLKERAEYKAEKLLKTYIELDRRCHKVTGKHVLPFTNDASVVMDITNTYLSQSAVAI